MSAAPAPTLHELAAAALTLIARAGRPETTAAAGWSAAAPGPGGTPIAVALRGPDRPAGVPQAVATPQRIAAERDWIATHRLTVRAPLVVLDLSWRAGEPLRVLGFSRGDWERELLALADERTPR